MKYVKYRFYSCQDFIMDDAFREIVRSHPASNELGDIIAALPENEDEINLAVAILVNLQSPQNCQPEKRKQELWNNIVETQKLKYLRIIFRVAAAVVVLAGIGSLIYYRTQPAQNNQRIAVISNKTSDDKAKLVLSNGKTFTINSKQSTISVNSDGSGILVNDSSGIAQPMIEGENQLIVPYGKRSKIILSDGTKVWINSGSKLTFPPVFKGANREVTLTGEALFDVTKDPAKPFFVKTENFKLKVYGTRFNVQAYEQEQQENIVLVEGKISMNLNGEKEVFLSPYQKATLSKGEMDFQIQNVEDTELYTAWIEGYLVFKNEDIKEVLKRVSRYYNVPIEVDLPSDRNKIFGKLDLKDNIERVLQGIAFVSKTMYIKEDQKYKFIKIK